MRINIEKKIPQLIPTIFIVALILSLIPMAVLAFFDAPSADDYSYSAATYHAIQNGEGLSGALSAAANTVAKYYQNWQGTFSAIFLFSLMPGIWGLRCYCITPFVVLAPVIAGMFLLYRESFEFFSLKEKQIGRGLAAITLLFFFQFLPEPAQGIYWYNGAIHYMFFFGLLLIELALLISFFQKQRKMRALAAALLALCIGGGNYVIALTATELCFLLLLVAIWKKRETVKYIAPAFACVLLSLIISAFAPGNSVRQAKFQDHPGAIAAILQSFVSCASTLKEDWISLPWLGMVVLALPTLCYAVKQMQRSFSFPIPGAVSLFSFCLLSSMFTPPIYAMGNTGEGRVTNVIYGAFLILTVGNLFYWLGWLKRRKQLFSIKLRCLGIAQILGIIAALTLIVITVKFQGETITSVSALGELRSGEAQRYYETAEIREELLIKSGDQQETLILPSIDDYPTLLFYMDITEDPNEWTNAGLEEFYGKTKIAVK